MVTATEGPPILVLTHSHFTALISGMLTLAPTHSVQITRCIPGTSRMAMPAGGILTLSGFAFVAGGT